MKQEACEVFVGIDVSKDHLDVAVLPSRRTMRCTNDEQGVLELAKKIAGLEPTLIVLESTGSCSRNIYFALAAGDLPVVMLNPQRVYHFRGSEENPAKTDRLDSFLLARFAMEKRPELRPIPDEQALLLKECVTRRLQLVDARSTEQKRLSTAHKKVRPSIESHIAWLDSEIEKYGALIDQLIEQHAAWNEKNALVQSVPGVGRFTAQTLIADLPELGLLSHKQIARLVGVAPITNESGQFKGKSFIQGGRSVVRRKLYRAIITAIVHNPVIREFYLQLRSKGKPAKVALIACVRKLLVILNAMMRDKTTWRPPATA